jgi:endonuclease/exonuclease/phosphatase family metal-dependent hydrolase
MAKKSVPENTIRLLTYNIHKGFNAGNRKFVLKNIKTSIDQVHADLVCLQEVQGAHSTHQENVADWPEQSQFEFLAQSTWKHYAYGKNAVYTEGHHGNAVLSKFPILSWENEDVSFSKIERRGLLHAVITLPGSEKPVHVFSLHLGLFEKDRRAQILKLAARIAALVPEEDPVIIAGDFNDWRQNASDLIMQELGLEEACISVHGEHAKTFPSWWPALALDRIYFRHLVCKTVQVLSGGVWNKLSDHLPLLAEFELP